MDTLGIIRQIEQDPALRAQLRAVLLGDEMLDLPQALQRLTDRTEQLAARMDQLAEAQAKTAAALDALARETDRRFDLVDRRFDLVDRRFDRIEGDLGSLHDEVGALRGENLELRLQGRSGHFVPRQLAHRARAVDDDRRDSLIAALSPEDGAEVERADGFIDARSPADGSPILFVVEVSWTAHADDVERAARRAALLERAGIPARGLVVSQVDPAEVVLDAARSLGVAVASEPNGLLVAGPSSPAA